MDEFSKHMREDWPRDRANGDHLMMTTFSCRNLNLNPKFEIVFKNRGGIFS
jgi:hypothetical protein